GQLGLGDLLGRIAVAAILDPLDLAVEVVLQLLRVGEREGGRLHDRRGQRVRRLGPRLAAVDGQRARSHRFLGWLDPVAHHDTSSRDFSTWRAMARATRLGSAGCSTSPLSRCSVRMARLTLTGLPIWIAVASVGWAVTGSNVLKSSWNER